VKSGGQQRRRGRDWNLDQAEGVRWRDSRWTTLRKKVSLTSILGEVRGGPLKDLQENEGETKVKDNKGGGVGGVLESNITRGHKVKKLVLASKTKTRGCRTTTSSNLRRKKPGSY